MEIFADSPDLAVEEKVQLALDGLLDLHFRSCQK